MQRFGDDSSIHMSSAISIADVEFWTDRDVKALREEATFA